MSDREDELRWVCARIHAPVVGIGLLSLLFSCGRAPEPEKTERFDSAGVQIVRNLAADTTLAWTFTPLFSLRGGPSGNVPFFRRSVGADSLGRIYVLDRGSHGVMVFDSEGGYLRTQGREGGGPGELGTPVSFAVTPGGVTSVFDVAKHGLVNFAADGSVLPGVRLNVSFTGGMIARSEALLGVAVSESGPTPGKTMDRILGVQGGDTLELARLEKAGPVPVTLQSCGVTLMDLLPFFQPSLIWELRGESVFASTSAEYTLDVISKGRLIESFRREVPLREATLQMATAEAGEGMRIGGRICEAGDIAQQAGYAPVIQVLTGIRVAPDGKIWLKRHTLPGEPSLVDILSETGEYLGTLPPGSPFPAAFLPGDRVVVEEVGEFEEEKVTVYRVTTGE